MPDAPGPNSPRRPSTPARQTTRAESAQEIRQALQARHPPTMKELAVDSDTTPFRPVRRPPMALLCIIDDGEKDNGEWVRIRRDQTILGRTEGEIVIAHDTTMSSKHAELSREMHEGAFIWRLKDLGSTNGTYVRVGSAILKPGQEMLLGSRRYRFEMPAQAAALLAEANENFENKSVSTSRWQGVSPMDLFPTLVELTAHGEGQRYPLRSSDNMLGRNPSTCSIVLSNDPLVSPQHARIHLDKKSRWHVENAKSLNGIWVRVDEMVLEATCQFQLGEQRFFLRVL